MHAHANACLMQKSRLRLVSQHMNDHHPLADLAAEAGISLRYSYNWLARYRAGSASALVDRCRDRRNHRRTLHPEHLQHDVELCHQRLHMSHIARMLALPSPPSPGP